MCPVVLRANCLLQDRGDEEAPQDGWAEHLSRGQPLSMRSRAGWGAAGAAPTLGIRHLHGNRERMKPVWDVGLQVSYRNHSQTQPGMSMLGVEGAICY